MTTEKIAKPIVNRDIPAAEEKKEPDKIPIQEVKESPERKQQSELRPEVKRLKSGEVWLWEWVGDMQENELYNVVKSALNILDQTKLEVNLVGDIARYLINMYGDNPAILYKAARQELNEIPNNYGNPLTSLVRNLEIKFNELMGGEE